MQTTKVFKSGNSMAVRLPKDFQIQSENVEIFKRGNDIIIREIPTNLSEAFSLLQQLPDDFLENGRKDSKPQTRDDF